MKDAFMQKITAIPSCLTEAVEVSAQLSESASESSILSSEGYRRVRRSAAMIGLAISMSATGMLLPSKNEAALAVESAPSEAALTSLPAANPVAQESPQAPAIKKVQLASPAIRHEVQQGESLWQLAEEYQVAPAAIAASNKISPQTELIVGQTLKIPSSLNREADKQSVSPVNPSDSQSLKTSLSHLQETRQRLQDSLSELKSEKTKLKTELATVPTEVADVSQSAQTTLSQARGRITALSTDVQDSQAIEIPVPTPETDLVSPDAENHRDLRRPIPVAIPTPATQGIRQASIPLNSPTPLNSPLPKATSFSLPKKEDINGKASLPALETIPTRQNSSEFNRPIPIPVPSPETASISTYEQRAINANPIKLNSPEATPGFLPVESPQPRAVTPANSPVYQVQPGDTLNTIARRYGLSVSELIQANGIGNPNLIKVNQPLVIPQKSLAQKTRQNPTVISDLPLPGSRLNSAQSQLSAPSVFTPAPIRSLKADNRSQNLTQPNLSAEAVEIPVESPAQTYTEKLKADFTSQSPAYQNRPAAIPIAVQPAASDTRSTGVVVGEAINPEWSSDKETPLPAERQKIQTQASEPSSPSVSSVSKGVVSREPHPQSQLVGAASTDAEQYNDLFNLPVGETVGPELPSLSVPDNYLPDTPMHFTGYIWPTRGVITSGFGRRWGRMHKGIDIASPIGTPVMAAASGEVIAAGWNSGGYGNLVKVQHPDGSITLYGHNSRILVRRGQIVQQGEQIAEMGSTGFSTGPHLHFEVHPDGRAAVNPIAYLPRKRS